MEPQHISILLEFLEACVYQVLKSREIYTAELFDRNRLYNCAIWRPRHPGILGYVHDHLESLREPLQRSDVRRLALLILEPHSGFPIERFVFDLQPPPPEPPRGPAGDILIDYDEIERNFRACLTRITLSSSELPPLPRGATFELVAYATRPAAESGLANWVDESTGNYARVELDPDTAQLVPIRPAALGPLGGLHLFVEVAGRR